MSRLSAFQRIAKIFKSGIVEPLLNFFCNSSALVAVYVAKHKVRNLSYSAVFFHFGNDDMQSILLVSLMKRSPVPKIRIKSSPIANAKRELEKTIALSTEEASSCLLFLLLCGNNAAN